MYRVGYESSENVLSCHKNGHKQKLVANKIITVQRNKAN